MSLPKVRIRRGHRGWYTTCAACDWIMWRPGRRPLDTAAIEHYASHARKGTR